MTGSEAGRTDSSTEGLGQKEDKRLGGCSRGMFWVGGGVDAVVCNPDAHFKSRGQMTHSSVGGL